MVHLTIHRECPLCRGFDVRTSRLLPGERFLNLLLLKPLRCVECDCRFLGWIFAQRRIPAGEVAPRTDVQRKVS